MKTGWEEFEDETVSIRAKAPLEYGTELTVLTEPEIHEGHFRAEVLVPAVGTTEILFDDRVKRGDTLVIVGMTRGKPHEATLVALPIRLVFHLSSDVERDIGRVLDRLRAAAKGAGG